MSERSTSEILIVCVCVCVAAFGQCSGSFLAKCDWCCQQLLLPKSYQPSRSGPQGRKTKRGFERVNNVGETPISWGTAENTIWCELRCG